MAKLKQGKPLKWPVANVIEVQYPSQAMTKEFPLATAAVRFGRNAKSLSAPQLSDEEAWRTFEERAPQEFKTLIDCLHNRLRGHDLTRIILRGIHEGLDFDELNPKRQYPAADRSTLQDCSDWLELLVASRNRGNVDAAVLAALCVGISIGRLELTVLRRKAPSLQGGQATQELGGHARAKALESYDQLSIKLPGRKISWYAKEIAEMKNPDGTKIVGRAWRTIRDYILAHRKGCQP